MTKVVEPGHEYSAFIAFATSLFTGFGSDVRRLTKSIHLASVRLTV